MANISATGYVHRLIDGHQTFPQFVWSCARAFGALVALRDDDSAPIPDALEVDAYYNRSLAEAKAELAAWDGMTANERYAWAVAHIQKLRDDARRQAVEVSNDVAQVRAMLAQVDAWTPPTPDHEGLRTFMLEQLNRSLSDTDHFERNIELCDATRPEDMVSRRGERLAANVASAEKMLREEVERVTGRNQWLAALRASVGPDAPCADVH